MTINGECRILHDRIAVMHVFPIERKLLKKVGYAINTYDMIHADDTVVVALSGGKDSYALLELLHLRLRYLPIRYSLVGVHIDFGTNPEQVAHIEAFCNERSIPCVIEQKKLPSTRKEDISCFWCAWNRRKALFEYCGRTGIRTLAFGHTMDDAIETLLMNMCYQSKIESFYPKTLFFGGEIHVVRPLILLSNEELAQYACHKAFPVAQHACPYGIATERQRIRKILATLCSHYENTKKNLLQACLKHEQK